MDNLLVNIIGGIVVISVILAFIGMWNSKSDRMTDQELYGMDADEYLKSKEDEN